MPDLGSISIEVAVINDTRGNLSVLGMGAGADSLWVQGETPGQGDELPQYQASKWGVYTDDLNATVTAQIQLTGIGSYPVVIVLQNDHTGNSICKVTGNDGVSASVTQVQTGSPDHALFQAQLIPALRGTGAK